MKISIFIDKKESSYEVKRLYEEIKNFNNINIINYNTISFPNYNLDLNSDIYYFFRSDSIKIYPIDILLIARELEKNGKIVINKNISEIPILDKIYIYKILYDNNFPIPKTIRIFKDNMEDSIEYIKNNLNFPIIVKHPRIHRGKFVKLLKDEKDIINLLSEFKNKSSMLLFQEYINYEKDLRIIFIGEPIGAMQRINPKDFRANISQGGYGLKYELDDELIEFSYKISEVFNMQIFAFDVLIDKNGNKYIIDLHRRFQFQGFEKYLNINVARKILEYLNSLKN